MRSKIKLLFLTILIYGLPIYIFSIFPFSKKIYPNFESFESPLFNFLLNGRVAFSSLGIIFDVLLIYCIYLLFFKKNIAIEKERVYLIYTSIKKLFHFIFADKLKTEFVISKEEKTSLLLYVVKLFWAPLMLIFAIENSSGLYNLLHQHHIWSFNSANILKFYFPLYISAIFTLDTFIFSSGYLFESSNLKNVVRSVDPTMLGWISAIVCYGPFFDTFIRFAGPLPQDFADFGNTNLNIASGLFTLVLFSIYVWASVALGFKASNLTNRGIVSSGPYKYVRHPAYIAKNLGWWVASIPLIKILGIKAIINLSIWTFVYFMRALTEEKHLLQDPDYVAYTEKVKYMFIPGIF